MTVYNPSESEEKELMVEVEGKMNKQEFINKISEVGNGKPIDVSAIDPCEKYNQWCVNSASDFTKWDERIDSELGRAIFIDNISDNNPPTLVSNIRFYSEGNTQVDELDETWLTNRINELSFATPTPTPTGICGDVNCDGKVNIQDATLLMNHVSYPGDPQYAICDEWAADVNCDGKVNIQDATLLMNHVSYPGDPEYALKCCTTPTPTPTPTPTATPRPPVEYIKCLFPRIFTQNPAPRILTMNPIPRISCLMQI